MTGSRLVKVSIGMVIGGKPLPSMKSPQTPPKPILHSIAVLLAAFVVPCVNPRADAATYTWDGNPGTAGAQDGAGTWDAVSTNWINGGSNVIWANGNDATFGAGTNGSYGVTVALSPTANSLIFGNSGYTLSAASAQTITLNSTTASIRVANGKTATPPRSRATMPPRASSRMPWA